MTVSRADTPGDTGGSTPPVLEARELSKAFGPTQALDACSFDLRVGEVHALLGENGSGKSTLVKMLAGVHEPDGGELIIAGRSVSALRSPRDAILHGIAAVFQEVLVAGSRSVCDNVWLGSDRLFRRRVTAAEKRRQAAGALASLLGDAPDLDTPVERVSLSVRQACVIARALVRDPRVLILDEATSALDVNVRDRLFDVLGAAATRGTAILFISHRMEEIDALAHRITVMRAGRAVATRRPSDTTTEELVHLMTGGGELVQHTSRSRAVSVSDDTAIAVRGVTLAAGRPAIDLTVRRGELLGLAGLEGQGQDDLLRALAGLRPITGEIICGDAVVRTPQDAARCRIAYVARERRAEGIFESRSVLENFGLPTLRLDVSAGLIRRSRTRTRFQRHVDALHIRMGEPEDTITTLSGGNQQKVIMARWLATDPAVLLLNDPTRGIDLGAKRDLYAMLSGLVADGLTVVMLSSELDEHVEHVELMDRVLVLREHAVEREFDRHELSREALVSAFFGRG